MDSAFRERADARRARGMWSGSTRSHDELDDKDIVFFGTSPLRVDLLGSAAGVDFAGVHRRAVETSFDGVPVRVMALDDLITNKRAAGRPRDLDDCAVLERVRAKRRP